MDYSSPPGPDDSVASPYLISCGVLAVVAAALCITRIYTRSKPTPHLSWDDYIIVIAEIFSLSSFIVAAAAAAYGWGRWTFYVPADERKKALKCLFVVQLFYIFAIACGRISVACSLLRFGTSIIWRGILWFIIGLHILISSGWIVILFGNCRPLRANWELVPTVKCWPNIYTINYGWASAATFVAMDLTMALLPLHLLWKLRRPRRERILIGVLMAMGLLATGIAGMKMTFFTSTNTGDGLRDTVESSTWAKLEEIVIIIAACMPCLKRPAERMLKHFGVVTSQISRSMAKPSFVKSTWAQDLNLRTVPHKRSHPETLNSLDAHGNVRGHDHDDGYPNPPPRAPFANESTTTIRTDTERSEGGAAPRHWEAV